MSPPIAELEKSLAGLFAEHKVLLAAVQKHQEAMRSFKTRDIAAAGDAIEASRTKIVFQESRRRQLMAQVVRTHKFAPDISLADMAAAVPAHRLSLLKLRDQLKQVMTDIAARTRVSSRIANGMLGHLNTVVRLIAGAMQQAAVYTRAGVPTVSARVGVMEAVG